MGINAIGFNGFEDVCKKKGGGNVGIVSFLDVCRYWIYHNTYSAEYRKQGKSTMAESMLLMLLLFTLFWVGCYT